jgi:two-component system, NtrC family, sensor kinase
MSPTPDSTLDDPQQIIADLQRANAELQRRLDERTSERDDSEAQKTAITEVLGVINSSPGDLGPVFEAMLEKAMRLCEAAFGSLLRFDGEFFRRAAIRNFPPPLADRNQPITPFPGSALRRLVEGEPFAMIEDITADQATRSGDAGRIAMAQAGAHTAIWVALRKDDKLLGAFVAYRQEVRPFSDKQITLLQNFAAQAVIAMENARLLGELRERTGDLQEALEYQTATSDVLKVMSGSAFELAPVLQAVVSTAVRLCRADQATIYRLEEGEYRWAADHSLAPDYERIERNVRIRPGTGTLVGRVALSRDTVQILDAWTEPLYEVKEDARIGGVHTMLGVPLLREGLPIGVIGLARRRIEPYTEKETELVRTFADQAVIAIENARLITETREALEQQTATAEVLGVINSSPGDLQPVFEAILEKAHNLCTDCRRHSRIFCGRVTALDPICLSHGCSKANDLPTSLTSQRSTIRWPAELLNSVAPGLCCGWRFGKTRNCLA